MRVIYKLILISEAAQCTRLSVFPKPTIRAISAQHQGGNNGS